MMGAKKHREFFWRGFAIAIITAALVGPTTAQVTQRVSLSSNGGQSNGVSGDYEGPTISADGRYVAFHSAASNLVPGDTNGYYDVFVRDRQTGVTERVSLSSSGVQGNNNSGLNSPVSISADGRFVAFRSSANNLVAGDTNGRPDIFVRDRLNGTTDRVSVDSGGVQGNGDNYFASISADGRFAGFTSAATNLVPGDTNGQWDVFVRDRQLGTTERVSVDSAGMQGNATSAHVSFSAAGRFVAFASLASNLVAGDTNGAADVFVRDRQTGTTERVSVSSAGGEADSFSTLPVISRDGRFVAFASSASNLVAGDANGQSDVFVRDRQLGTTERASVSSSGAEANDVSCYTYCGPTISDDGRFVEFWSAATNLVPGDTNGQQDIFLRDRQLGTTERVSISYDGVQANGNSYSGAISSDGRFVAFDSDAPGIVPEDTNGFRDVFVRDRLGGPAFTSLCVPGASGVIACPCGNPPGGPDRGCDNSASTGGAFLSAAGGALLSSDTLVFTTSGEKPTATSILLQGTTSPPAGIVYGQGVRCVGGGLKRLFVKAAVAGSITAPDFGAGDPNVSARSAAKGDVIQPGQSRWYLVYYRDPIVLGGCPPGSTFNATQTGQVSWWP